MAIRWDALLARHVAIELEGRLKGARLRALRFDGAKRDVVLFFRESTLVWHLHPTRGGFRFHPATEPGEGALRLASRVRRVHAPADERIIVFRLLPVRGRAAARDLVVELLGNQWNCLVVEGPERILRHVLHTRSSGRVLRVGQPYAPPEPSRRAGKAGSLSRDEWSEQLQASAATDNPGRALVREIAWTSPILRDALLADPAAGWTLWSRFADPDAVADPQLLETPKGPQPYPFPVPGITSTSVESLAEAFALSEPEVEDSAPAEALLDPLLLERLEGAIRGAGRRLSRLESELGGAEDPADLRAIGDLILARYHEIPRDVEVATLTDFGGDSVEVRLVPGDAPHEAAERYYDRAGRAQRAAERLPELIAAARREVEKLEALRRSAQEGSADEESLRNALPPAPTRDKPGGKAAPTLPYRSYRSSGGIEIRVGRGARKNDDLTFRHSSPNDVWMHARHTAGAHVLLRWAGPGNPPARDLEEAAILAALHSKARTSGSVPVDWTLRKYVRKPRGAAPGSVVPDRVKTVFVDPDPAVAERLAE